MVLTNPTLLKIGEKNEFMENWQQKVEIYYLVRLAKDVPWEEFRKVFIKYGGEKYYAAWLLNYQEPIFRKLGYKKGISPVAEKYQKQMIQLKTNINSQDYAKKQADILRKTMESFT